LSEQSTELVELHLCRIAMSKSRGPFHLTDDRIKGTVSVLRGTEVPQARVRVRVMQGCLVITTE